MQQLLEENQRWLESAGQAHGKSGRSTFEYQPLLLSNLVPCIEETQETNIHLRGRQQHDQGRRGGMCRGRDMEGGGGREEEGGVTVGRYAPRIIGPTTSAMRITRTYCVFPRSVATWHAGPPLRTSARCSRHVLPRSFHLLQVYRQHSGRDGQSHAGLPAVQRPLTVLAAGDTVAHDARDRKLG